MAGQRRPVRGQLSTSEKQWQDTVMRAARLNRWLCFHDYDSRKSEPGFPDCIFIRGGRLLAIELKTETGRLSKAQEQWLAAFAAVPGAEAYCFRPSEWKHVEKVLR